MGDYLPRTFITAAIVIVHLAVAYVLFTMGARIVAVGPSVPVMVSFIAEPQQVRHWQPPEIKAVGPAIAMQVPDMPVVEIPVAPPSDHAISASVHPQVSARSSAPTLVSTVEYLREPSPHYPPQSRRLREQGLVVLRVLIDEKGTACNIEIESSSGYARLDVAAREAVAKAAFRPYVEDGTPRRALVRIPIEFSLNGTTA